MKAYTDPNLKKIEAALDNIKKEYKMEKGQVEINEALSGLYDAKSKMWKLKVSMNNLAKVSSDTVDGVLKALDKFANHLMDKEKEIIFKKTVKRMLSLLEKTEPVLKNSMDEYEELEKSLNVVHDQVNMVTTELRSWADNEEDKIDRAIHKIRSEAYGYSEFCLAHPITCVFIYPAVVAGVEVTVNNLKEDLNRQLGGVTASQEVVADVIEETNNGLTFIKAEFPLIRNWLHRNWDLHNNLDPVDLVIEFVKLNEIDIFDEMIHVLDTFKQVCQDYLKHSEGNILIDATTVENI